MKKRLLWVEDGAYADLSEYAAALLADGRFDPTVALTASSGFQQATADSFDALIVDVRIPAGSLKEWGDLYHRSGSRKVEARLGLELLYTLLGHKKARIICPTPPGWLKADRVGILTVEKQQEIAGDLEELGIRVFREKTSSMGRRVIIDILEELGL